MNVLPNIDIYIEPRPRRRWLSRSLQATKLDRTGERATCTVAAVAGSMNLSWEDAHALAALGGRQPNKGWHSWRILDAAKKLGVAKTTVIFEGTAVNCTLGRFIADNPTGRFYVHSKHHAVSVVDGQVFSNRSYEAKAMRLTAAWRIEPQ